MTPSNPDIRSTVKEKSPDLFRLSQSLRDDMSHWVRRTFTRKSRQYAPYINPKALSRARPSRDGLPGSGGPFGALAMWLAGMNRTERHKSRAQIEYLFDVYDAADTSPVCWLEAMEAQQEADAREEVAETQGHLSGRWGDWVNAKVDEIAAGRIALVARRLMGAA